MKTPPIVSAQEWDAALQEMLVKEKEVQRARDALAAQRRRMPWLAWRRSMYSTDPTARRACSTCSTGRRQLIVYRAFFEPGTCRLARTRLRRLLVDGRPRAQPGPPQRARHHIRLCLARDAARPRAGEGADGLAAHPVVHHHRRLRQRLRRRRLARHERVHPRRRRPRLPHLFHQRPRRRGVRQHLELPRHDRPWAPRELGGFAGGLPADPAVRVVGLERRIREHTPSRWFGDPDPNDPNDQRPPRKVS